MKYHLLLSTFVVSLFASCDCDKKYTCGALSAEGKEWLNPQQGDTAHYLNGLGQHLNYVITVKSTSPEYEAQACQRDEIGCTCEYRCEATGRVYAPGIPGNDLFGTQGYTISVSESSDNNKSTGSTVNFDVIDFLGGINLTTPAHSIAPFDTLYQDLQLGGTFYHQVYSQWVDTTLSVYQNQKVWRIYFTKEVGVIGFSERELHSTFYLQ